MTSARVGYVAAMRKHIGSDLLLLPGVSVLVTDDRDRILMVEQADRGEWSTVGGAIEPGESPHHAALREASEEVGLDVELIDLVATVGGPGYEIVYPNGDRCAYVSIVFRAKVTGGDATPDGQEVADCAWVDKQQLNELPLSPFTRRLLTEIGVLLP